MRAVVSVLACMLTIGGVSLLLTGCNEARASASASPRPTATPSMGVPGIDVPPTPSVPFRMLFVGASITAGSGASTPMLAYPQMLAAQVAREVGRVDPVVVGHGGAVAAQASRWPLPEGEDLIMVHLATNDFEHANPIPSYGAEYRALLARLRATSPIASIICLGVWAASTDVNRLGLRPAAYDAEVRSACQSMGGSFVPLMGIYAEPDLHAPPARWRVMGGRAGLAGPDVMEGREIGFHPNDAGHERIAGAVFTAVQDRRMLRPPGQFAGARLARFA